jgi:hypothetical protein
MHGKLFLTLVGAAVCSYVIIRFIENEMNSPTVTILSEKREMGFAAIMKQTGNVQNTQ